MNSRRRLISIEILVFIVGASSLGGEIAATRLLAPWFGESTIVWANTIATVLVALSVGYAVGGRIADRRPEPALLSLIIFGAGVLLAAVPFISSPLLGASVDAFADIDAATFLGSLLAVGALIAVPMLLLGMVAPFAVRLAVNTVSDAGSVAGRLYAISTVGSLVGTFLAALLLIPVAGTRRTFWIFALSLVLASVPGLARWSMRRGVLPAGVAALAIAALLVVPSHRLKAGSADQHVLWESETQYQYARVLENDSGLRSLELNEGQAVHSVYREGKYLTDNYWDELLVLPFAARKQPESVAVLGNAAGTTARAMGHYFPETRIDGVEIDSEVSDAGRKYFDMQAPHLQVHDADARPWLRSHDDGWDAIIVDAYRQPYIPFYLTTKEFFELVAQRLNPGGVVILNVGHPEDAPELEKVLAATMREAFGDNHVFRDPSEPVNTMLVGTTSPETETATKTGNDDISERLRTQADSMPSEVARVANRTARRLEPALRGGRVYTDDSAPVEWLVDLSLAQVATD